MKTSTQVYRALKAAQFTETQARTLVEILQATGVVEPEAPESELDRIEHYLSAETQMEKPGNSEDAGDANK